MSKNGNCKHCGASFDGELVYETFLKQGQSEEEAKNSASFYAGFNEYGLENRWGRQLGVDGGFLGIYDGIVAEQCPDCGVYQPRNDSPWALDLFNKYMKAVSK